MKKQTGIWIDSEKAVVVKLANDTVGVNEVYAADVSQLHHHSAHAKSDVKMSERKKHDSDHFLDHILHLTTDSDELYVFGPSETKSHFKHRFAEHKNEHRKLMAVESADHLTLNQVIARVKQFYEA